MLREEVILWHKWPETKPPAGKHGYYLISTVNGVDFARWYYGRTSFSRASHKDVLAWAEIPKGWNFAKSRYGCGHDVEAYYE